MEIIYNKNGEQLNKLISKKFKYFKIVFVANFYTEKYLDEFLNQYELKTNKIEKIILPNCVESGKLISQLTKTAFTDDVGLIVLFGNSEDYSLITNGKTNIKIATVVCDPMCSYVNKNTNYLIVFEDFLSRSTHKSVANAYGYVCANLFYLLEEVFNKAIYKTDGFSPVNLLEVENYLQKLLFMPTSVLKSIVGKNMLFNIGFKINNQIKYDRFKNSLVYNLALNLKKYNKYKTLQMGEALMLSSYVCFNLLKFILINQNYNNKVMFSCYSRLKTLRKVVGEFSIKEFNNGINLENLQEEILNLNNLKDGFLNVYNNYNGWFFKMFKNFKELYFNLGVSLNKYLSGNVIHKSLYVIPETVPECLMAKFVRDVGLFNKF